MLQLRRLRHHTVGRRFRTGAAAATTTLTLLICLATAPACVPINVAQPAVRYLAFGDSTTSGPAERNYPEILAELLGEASEAFANEGHGGESAGEGVVRLQALLSQGIYPNAEVLLYWQGGAGVVDFIREHDRLLVLRPDSPDYPFAERWNEKLTEIQSDVESAIAAAGDFGLRVYVATYFALLGDIIECDPVAFDVLIPVRADNANVYIDMLNTRIRTAAANRTAALVDIAALDDTLRSTRANYVNCNHLSTRGNELVAALFHQAMQN